MNPLASLLDLPHEEKVEKGVLYTPAEIAQQPRTWPTTFHLFERHRSAIQTFLSSAGLNAAPQDRPTVLLVGAGSSDYVGRSLMALLRRQWACEVVACPSTDLVLHAGDILRPGQRYLCISFSRSGDSPEGVAVLQRLLTARPDIQHLVVTCNREGQMARETSRHKQAFTVCLDDAVNDRGLAMTSSFTNMVVFGHCLAHLKSPELYADIVMQLADAGERFLPVAAGAAAELARGDYQKACFVGTGTLHAVARESALKVLEMTAGRITTMSESSLGLRHGPMAALDHTTFFVCFLSTDPEVRRHEQALLKEIGSKQLVKTRIAVGGGPATEANGWAENFLPSCARQALADDYRTPLDVMFGQLLGLFFSLRCNLRPDSPSPSGAISRVVQNVSFS